ncbi:MAG: flagellar basal body P-ring formation protein FlgA [Proteobacteria bacterium]|nr:flagellar basal body P-ring formation protein FlgA [Pseudomonadota bacterium]
MYRSIKLFKFLAGLLVTVSAAAQQAPVAPQTYQDTTALHQTVEQFLQTQTAGLPGQVSVTVNQFDTRLRLVACAAPQPFMPPGSRVWGRTTVGVRCTAPAPWTVYIAATVRVMADYLTAAGPLAQGKVVEASDVILAKGDLAALPPGILTNPAQAIGRSMTVSLAAGMPLRQDSLRAPQAIQQNQSVRLTTAGKGFQVTTEGKSLNNAAAGQVVQVRTANGQIVSGVAKAGGIVEVSY